MARHPIADDRGELTDLRRETTIIPRRGTQRVFVEPNLSAVIARIKAAIEPRLCKEINLRSDLGVEKKRESRIKEIINIANDQPGRRLFEIVKFQIESAAQSCAQIIMKCRERKRGVDSVEKIIDIERARGAGKDAQLHATALPPSAAGKRTSNSVQSFSERTRHKSPPCSRASSRARFKPIPSPEAAEGVGRRVNRAKISSSGG